MTFNVQRFNNDEGKKYDVDKNFGELKFLGFKTTQEFVDGKPTNRELASHVIVFSEKLGDTIDLKLPDGYIAHNNIPFMSSIRLVGVGAPYIYNFDNVRGGGDNAVSFVDYGFSLKIKDVEVKKGENKPQQTKQEG